MRILFMSGTPSGGAARSTHALAARLAERGHDVRGLFRSEGHRTTDYLYKRAVNLYTKLGRHPAASGVDMVARRLGGRRRSSTSELEYPVELCPVPENGLRHVARRWRPDVAVVCSIERVGWRRIRDALASQRIPSVLYLREAVALGHLTISNSPPDLLVANAESHAARARALGYECVVIPSVVEPTRTAVRTTRRVALLVNPIPAYGVHIAWEMARMRPDVPFVFQKSSWPIAPEEDAAMAARAAALGNVEVREFTPDASRIYRDARVLLAPYEADNRPRVVAEAQANGIPVIATDHPALREAVGPGGALVPAEAGARAWARRLASLWDDPVAYQASVTAALAHAARPEIQPSFVVDMFELALRSVVDSRHG